jgi:hypothetical protein
MTSVHCAVGRRRSGDEDWDDMMADCARRMLHIDRLHRVFAKILWRRVVTSI